MRRAQPPPAWLITLLMVAGAALASAGSTEDAQMLLSLKTSADSAGPGTWDAALASSECQASQGAAWVGGTLPCGSPGSAAWRGVSCDTSGEVTGVSLPFCGLQGTLPVQLAQLPQLKTLDLSHNKFTGGVPAAWTAVGAFPKLDTLNLAFNFLSGGLDDFTMDASGFIATSYFNVSTNDFSDSPLPADWYSRTLTLMDVAYNNISEGLPLEWGLPKPGHESVYSSAFPALERLAIEGNNLSGNADPWPRGSANVFGPDFLCTADPGNELLYMTPAPMPAMEEAPADAGSTEAASSSSGGLSGGAIAGIVVGAVAGLALVAVLVAFVVRKRRGFSATSAGGPAAKSSVSGGSASSDVEDGKVGGTRHDYDSAGRGSAYGGGKAGGMKDQASDLSSGALLAGSAASEYSRADSGRTFGSQLVDTDARRLPSDWNTVLFSELEMECAIGAGSFGAVWRAKYCQTSVAVKILGVDKTPGVSDTIHQRKITRQLEKEAGIMSKLRHTNCCLYMGACLEPPCLLMEYCARKSVDSLLAQGLKDKKAARQLSWPRLLSMASDAAKGMVYLHTRQPAVYHRDLKSANLLVTSQWQVKVADFNLSRALEPHDFMSSLCIQNPRWLAPEVLAGEDGGLPADVWSFGTVLWELMTWRAPFEGANPYQIINIVQATNRGSGLDVPGPEDLPAGTLGEYEPYVELVEACWERKPSERPTFEEIVSRLRTILQAEMRRNSTSSPLGSAQTGSNQPSLTVPSLTTASALGTASAIDNGPHSTFEAATKATSRAFQEALRDSFGSSKEDSPFAAAQVNTATGSLDDGGSLLPPKA